MAKDPTGYSIDLDSAKRIGRVVREVETNQKLPPTTNRRSRFNGPMVEGIMLENLAGTDDPNVPTKARFQIKSGLQSTDGWANDPAPSILTIWNRTTTSVSIDQVVFAKELYPDRWHLIVGGGAGSHHIWATIQEVFCDEYTDTIDYVLALPIRWTGGCDASQVPGADPYTYEVEVVEICEIFTAYYTQEQLVGKTIRATYMKTIGADPCVFEWIVDAVCGTPECA